MRGGICHRMGMVTLHLHFALCHLAHRHPSRHKTDHISQIRQVLKNVKKHAAGNLRKKLSTIRRCYLFLPVLKVGHSS
ncbi:hypothetical protein NEOLEDRAFT_1115824 [Neolentinus lepideus HHB14362 ss-1]|uniref:Secreted protein n=1 Tax=Neolentinus lepideus HHB14362 ss-1 TaxID=1314782 RepID=A0A165S4U1_9AGAM|nr:hypothetical protein NEOLEDRAFT_1115824 [Neolentinus lepideus HHB14362 ss-1]